jgi:hypothetical protein
VIVELQVQQVIFIAIVGLDRLFHPLDDRAQGLQLRRRDRFGEPSADELVHHRTHVVDFRRLVVRNVAHEHATVLLLPHEAGLLEHPERLADRAA